MSSRGTSIIWPPERNQLEFHVDRSGECYGPVYLQWEVVTDEGNKDKLASYFPNLAGDLRMANREEKTLLKVATFDQEQVPYLEEDVAILLRTVVVTNGVGLSEGSELLPLTLAACRGVVSARPCIQELDWPVQERGVEFDALRENGSNGPAYLQWEIPESPQGIAEIGDVPATYSDTLARCLRGRHGDLRFAHGETTTKFYVPTCDTSGPVEDAVFPVRILPVSPGVKIKDGCEFAMFSLKKSHPGTVGFAAGSYEMETVGKESVPVPVLRENGSDGNVSVEYSILDGSSRSGVHHSEESTSGIVCFQHGEVEKDIAVFLVPDALYRQPVTFIIELGDTTGGAITNVDSDAAEVTLLGNYVEPPGAITFGDEEEDESFDATKSSFVSVPIKRIGGTVGKLQILCSTESATALDGVHYKSFHEILTFDDGEEIKEIQIEILPEKYRSFLQFQLKLSDPDSNSKDRVTSKKTITLSPTDQEPAGKIFLLPTETEPPGVISIDERIDVEVNPAFSDFINIGLHRRHGTGGDVAVRVKTQDGSAVGGSHYQELNEVATFKHKEDYIKIPIPILLNSYRNLLHFQVEISDPTGGAKLGDVTSLKITLLPTDTEPVGRASLAESDAQKRITVNAASDKVVRIPIRRIGGVGGEIEVHYETKEGTAKAGEHFVSTEGTLVLADREEKGNICIPLLPSLYCEELDFVVKLIEEDEDENVSNTATITLLPTDNEPPGKVSLPEDDFLEVDAKTCDCLYVPIRRHDGVGGDVSVKIKSLDGSAVDGIHYKGIDGIVTLRNRQDNVEIPIAILPEKYKDALDFAVKISDPQGGATIGQHQLIVKLLPTQQEPRGRLVAPEGNSLSFNSMKVASATIPLRRVGGNNGVLSAEYFTVECTGSPANHYQATDGTLVLADGQEEALIEVPLLQKEHTNNVQFKLVVKPLSDPGERGPDDIEIFITLEPTEASIEKSITLPINNITVLTTDEDVAVIPVLRPSDSLHSKVVVPFKTKGGTAKPKIHFVPVEGQLEIPEGDDGAKVRIPLIEAAHKLPLTFEIEFDDDDKSCVCITLLPTLDNPPGRVEFGDSSYTFTLPKDNAEDGTIFVPVRRRKGTGGRVEVDYFTRDNSAISGKHYQDTSGKLVFEDGESCKMIDIQLLPRSSFAQDVSYVVELGTAYGGAEVAEIYETEITLEPPLDATDPGMLGFASTKTYFTSSKLKQKRKKRIKVEIPVRRTLGCGGNVAADFFLRDNMALSGKHYVDAEGEVRFEDKEAMKIICVDLLPGPHYTEPISFTAELGETYGGAELGIYETEVLLNPRERQPSRSSTSSSSASSSSEDSSSSSSSSFSEDDSDISIEIRDLIAVKVADDGSPGQVGFMRGRYDVIRGTDVEAVIPIARTEGFTGLVEVAWSTRESTAEADKDFVESYGMACFQDGEEEVLLRIPLLDERTPDAVQEERSFIVELGQPEGGAALGRYESSIFILPHHQVSSEPARLVAPRNVRTVVNDATCFSVAWDPQEAPVHEYLVSYKRAGSHGEPKRHTVPSSEHSLTIEDLVPESAYAVVVSALGEGGQQLSSDVIACKLPGKIPGPPNRLAFQVLSPTSLNCSWGEPAITNGLITGYEVLYKPTDEQIGKVQPPVVVRIPDGHFRSLLVENLRENTAYAYTVRAMNKSGLGAPREATMKIEHVGSRPPSAIFLDEENMKIVQKQIELEEAQRQERMKNRSTSSTSMESDPGSSITTVTSRTQQLPTQDASSAATKTRVTRYIHREGRIDPEVETVEYDGRLTQEELDKKNVQVITYNTTRNQSSTSATEDAPFTVTVGRTPEEYSNTDVQTNVTQDTQVFTDVQESQDGDTEITTITKTYRTTTTERRMESSSGVSSVVAPFDGPPQNTKH